MVTSWIWFDHLESRIVEGLDREYLNVLVGMTFKDCYHYGKGNYGTNMRPLVF